MKRLMLNSESSLEMLRVHFLQCVLLLLWITLFVGCRNSTENSPTAIEDQVYNETNRLQYHFSPAENWMNDPNGMVYYEDEYHLFYQYYPDSNVWGPMHWGHAITEDLVTWEHLPIALYPDSLGYIFSGSAVIDWNNTSGFGQDDQAPMIAIYTYHDPVGAQLETTTFQTQGIAHSIDNGRTWTKYDGNPVIPNPGIRDFRDPKVIWDTEREQWLMVFAAYDHVRFYSSPNLKEWTFLSEFGQGLGNHNGVWECPDIFPMKVEGTEEQKWVLIVSIGDGGPNKGSATQYFVGNFDGREFTIPENELEEYTEGNDRWIDYGRDNYAGVTWSDIPKEDGRRLFLGWMSNWQYAQQVPTTVWRSAMTLPRSLQLKETEKGYRIFSNPVDETKQLRQQSWQSQNIPLTPNEPYQPDIDFNPELSEIICTVDQGEVTQGKFQIQFSNSSDESYNLGFDFSSNSFISDRSASGQTDFSDHFVNTEFLAPRGNETGPIEFRIFVDKGAVELFADGGEVVTSNLVFPTEPYSQLTMTCIGCSVNIVKIDIHELKRIW